MESSTTALGVALKEAERGATRSGGEARVDVVLECAGKEISASSLRTVYSDAAEFSAKRGNELPRGVYERAQRMMANALGVHQMVDGQVVGHALVSAAEGGHVNVVRRLRKGQAELRCSVLAPRFLAFALLKATEVGQVEVVEELLRSTNSAVLAMVGHELATKANSTAAQYPSVTVVLTKEWKQKLTGFKSLLPPATYVLQHENLELRGANSDQETVHEAVRSCYQIYCVWRLLVTAGANGHGGVFHHCLSKREDLTARAGATLMGYEHPKVKDLNNTRSRIDTEFIRFTSKITAKLRRDTILYSLHSDSTFPDHNTKKANPWRCTPKSQFGLWEVETQVPVLLMDVEGSYLDNEKKQQQQQLRNYKYIKPIIPQIMKLNVQFKVIIDMQPNYAELTIGINHVRVTFDNQSWVESETGHFPTRVSLSVTPVSQTLTSVTMTGSSTNTTFKVGVAENVRIGVSATLKAAPTAGISFQAGKTSSSKIDGKPWRMEQLPIYNERGGSYTWALTNLHGAAFDRLSPMLQEAKTSIWQFGKRMPINPLMVLPFGTNGGVNFTGSEFDDTISWRFSKELENSDVLFNVEGQVHTTFITQDRFWETREARFETQLQQKLEPCGDPTGADKKKKKKKK